MSSRRLARAGVGRASGEGGGIPTPLRSRHDPLWDDPTAVVALARSHGLRLSPRNGRSVEAAPWWARFDAFREAWCEANGLMHPQYPHTLDYRRAAESGIDMSASSRYRLAPNDGRNLPRD